MKHCSRCDRPAVRRGMCNSHYNTHRTRQMAYGRWQPDRVDAGPVRVHVQALRDSGLGFRRIAELSGVRRQTIQQLFSPRRGRSKPSAYVASATARKLLAVPVGEAAPGAHIDQTGTVRRLQALVAIGHSQSSLCTQLGITQSNSTRLFHGHSKVTAATAKRVAELYDRLSMVSGTNQRAIRRAKANGWLPPLAWDDDAIDDPGAQPHSAVRGARLPFPEMYREWRELGYSDLEIVSRFGIRPDALARQLYRYGLPISGELVAAETEQRNRRKAAS